jgi:hypothetical protein
MFGMKDKNSDHQDFDAAQAHRKIRRQAQLFVGIAMIFAITFIVLTFKHCF